VSDGIEKVAGDDSSVPWELHLAIVGTDLADALLSLVDTVDADLPVIGARRRSPVGKVLLGNVAHTVILQARLPVLVVKAP
jgi:nucleotide-binding universal stress UspA family protein